MVKKKYSSEINLIDLYSKILRHKILFISVILIFILASFTNYLIKIQKKYEYNWRVNEIHISDRKALKMIGDLLPFNDKFKKNLTSKNLSTSFVKKLFQIDLSSITSELIITNENFSISNDMQIEKVFDYKLIIYDQNPEIEKYFSEFLKFCRLRILDDIINKIEDDLDFFEENLAENKYERKVDLIKKKYEYADLGQDSVYDYKENLIKSKINSSLQSIEYIKELKLQKNFTLTKKSLVNQQDHLIFNLILGLFFGLIFSTILVHIKKK